MSERILSSEKICAGAQSVAGCVFQIGIVQLPVEKYGNPSGYVSVDRSVESDYVFFAVVGPECNLCG